MEKTQIIGLDRYITYLERCKASGRLGHSYLFIGPESTGKFLLAKHLAKMLNCQNGSGCGECETCLEIEEGRYLDVVEIKGKRIIAIDDVREAQRKMFLAGIGEWKVLLIDNAHTMTSEAANAFLKLQEEPPGRSVIVLITHRISLIANTVRSRAATLWIFPDAQAIEGHLGKHRASCGTEDGYEAALNYYEGRFGQLKNFLESPSDQRDYFFQSFTGHDCQNGLSGFFLEKSTRQEFKEKINLVSAFLRDCLIVKLGYDDLLINKDRCEIIRAYQQKKTVQQLLRAFEKISVLYDGVETANSNLMGMMIRENL